MRALVVEDDPRIAADLDRALTGSGFRVETVADGDSAWFRGGTENYDLIVLDLNLPRLDGLTVLKRWRAEGCESPVLILTARGDWTDKVAGFRAGADDYAVKPFRLDEVVLRCQTLIRRAAGQVGPGLFAHAFAGIGLVVDDGGDGRRNLLQLGQWHAVSRRVGAWRARFDQGDGSSAQVCVHCRNRLW